ncbi:hypothetical protein [Vibrio crassostreae]|jgi:hypothetical protein|uniref:hypothetical protein n=1 Tax=Vibrio crassostreae TaxID=246167 RepID=UPI000F4DA873|nr:hypothetical protein [Vibrio crassostreae]RPF11464.1 hypothetical protein EDB17_0095 [Vibrio crassostreae]
MKKMVYIKGNSENGYTVSMEFEKDVTSKPNQNASAQNIERLVEQQQKAARKRFNMEFPEAVAL